MIEVRQTEAFIDWVADLRDQAARKVIRKRLARVELGLLGDAAPVGEGVSELRIDFGPGYRVYFVRRGFELIVVLGGGNKSSQSRDIGEAKRVAKALN